MNKRDLESHAYKPVINFAGSVLVLTMALKFIGIDFAPVINAYSQSIIDRLNNKNDARIEYLIKENQKLNERLKQVESVAHAPNSKHLMRK